jgi:hypothetical protein
MTKGARSMFIRLAAWIVLVAISIAPAMARDPADPGANVPQTRYSPVISGTKSYRPVEPMPWGDVNRRVTPPDARSTPATNDSGAGPKTTPAR